MPVPENYGSYATLVDSIGIRGVSTDTKLIFIGNSPTGELNVPVTITTLSEASTKLGITSTTNPTEYNLASAVFAAFNVAGLAEVVLQDDLLLVESELLRGNRTHAVLEV